ncbi:MAG: hypothetical protein ACR2IJ_10640 [Fluviibacter sp.]
MNVVELPKRVNQDVVDILEQWLKQAKDGELQTVSLVSLRLDNSWQTAASSTSDNLRDCAMLIELAIRRMGFAMKGPE